MNQRRALTRRDAIRTGMGLGVAAFAGCAGSPFSGVGSFAQGSTNDWPTFQRDSANTGHDPTGVGPTTAVDLAWDFRTGSLEVLGKRQQGIIASPAIVNGTVYAGSLDGHVYAVDAETGDQRWNYDTGQLVTRSPAVVDDTVYIGTSLFEEHFYALSAENGAELWAAETSGRGIFNGASLSSPTVVDGTVYVGTADASILGKQGAIYAFDAATGDEQWRVRTDKSIDATPAVADDTVYVGAGEGTVLALTTDGDERWRATVGEALLSSSPTVVDDTIYVGSHDGHVYALNAGTGDERWAFATDGPVRGSPAVTEDAVYVGSDDGSIYTIDIETHEVRWRFETGSSVRSSPAVVDDTVYVGSFDGHVYAIAIDTGDERQRWRFATGGAVLSSPAVVADAVYVGSNDGRLYALKATDDPRSESGRDGPDVDPDDPIPAVLEEALPDPAEYIDGSRTDVTRSRGTVVVDIAGGELHILSDASDASVTAVAGVLAAEPPIARESWDGEVDQDSKRFGTSVAADVDTLAFAPHTFEGIALRAAEAVDLVVAGERVAADATLVRYSATRGVFDIEHAADEPSGEDGTGGELRWTFEVGEHQRRLNSSSPTVVGGILYFTRGGNVFALDVSNGDEVWRFENDVVGDSVPTVVDGTVYVGSHDDNVYAIDAASGEEEWVFETPGNVGSPTVTGGTVYVPQTGGAEDPYDSYIRAIDAASGEQQWVFPHSGTIRTSPTVVDGTVYVGSGTGRTGTPFTGIVYALDATSGTEEWSVRTEDEIESSPTVADGTVYVGCRDANVYALAAASGTREWTFETGGPVASSPTVVGSTLYVGSDDGNVYAIDAASGEEEWVFETGEEVYSSPTVADNLLFVGSNDSNVYAIDATDGVEVWAFETGHRVTSSPTVVDGILYVGGQDGSVYAITAGVEGSSDDSRVALGTLGHHHEWAGED